MSTALVGSAKIFSEVSVTDGSPVVLSEPVLIAEATRTTFQISTTKDGDLDIELSPDGPEGPWTKFIDGTAIVAGVPYYQLFSSVVTGWTRVRFTKTAVGAGVLTGDITSDSRGM